MCCRYFLLSAILILSLKISAQDAISWEQFDLTAKILPASPPEPKKKWHKQGWGMSMQWQINGVFNKPDDGFLLSGGLPDVIKTYFVLNPERNEAWVEYFEGLWGVEPNEAVVSTANANLWNIARLSLEMPPFIALHFSGGSGREQVVNGKVRARVFPFETPSDYYLIEVPVSYRVRSFALQAGAELRPGTTRIQAVLGGGYNFQRTTFRGDLHVQYQALSENISMDRSANIHGGFIDAGMRAYLYEGFFIQPVFSVLILQYSREGSFLSSSERSPEVQIAARVGIGYHLGNLNKKAPAFAKAL